MTTEKESTRREFSAIRPLVVGDRVEGRQILGFSWIQPPEPDRYLSNHMDDRLLVDGDEQLDAPPTRGVPQTSETAEPSGTVPPEPAIEVRHVDTIDSPLPWKFDALLDLPGAPWRPIIRPLLGAVNGIGHQLWLAGGAVRDVLIGRNLHEVTDLDLSGTLPPGRFSDLTRQVLRATPMAECVTTVSPDSLVCSVKARSSDKPLIEYRGLSRGGFRFAAVGSSLAEDALT
jgi:hypothetical protein